MSVNVEQLTPDEFPAWDLVVVALLRRDPSTTLEDACSRADQFIYKRRQRAKKAE